MKKTAPVSVALAFAASTAWAQDNPYKLWDPIPRLIERQSETHAKVIDECAASIAFGLDEGEVTQQQSVACSEALINHFIVVDQALGHAVYELRPLDDSQELLIDSMKAALWGNCMQPIGILRDEISGLPDDSLERASLINEFVFGCYQNALININGELSEVFGLSLFPHDDLQDIYDHTFCQGVVVPQSDYNRTSDAEQCRARFGGVPGRNL